MKGVKEAKGGSAMKTIMGNYQQLAVEMAEQNSYPLSYLSDQWSDVPTWQAIGRAKVMEYLSYSPKPCPLNPAIEDKVEKQGIVTERVSYDQPFGPRTEGMFIYPANRGGKKLPGIIALHCHGGFKYFGKEKLVAWEEEPAILTRFKKVYYGGRSWATELAKRGFAVFVPDVFLWGSRKLNAEEVPDEFAANVLEQTPGTEAYIEAYNEFAKGYETYIAKSLYLAGTTWTGIMAYEDRRAVDYLLTRPEVDGERLGCGGLSGGGLRTIFLAALDPRIKCAVCVGFMSTNREVVAHKINKHTWMLHVPHLSSWLDMPDIMSLHGKNPLMVQYDIDDPLWTMQGQADSDAKLKDIYAKMEAPDQYVGKFYPGPHKFDVEMQEDAFDWFSRWLQ